MTLEAFLPVMEMEKENDEAKKKKIPDKAVDTQNQVSQINSQKLLSQSEQLLELALDKTYYFNSAMEQTFVSLALRGHKETFRISSESFKKYLRLHYYNKHKKLISGHVLDEIVEFLDAKALFEGPTESVYKRVAESNKMIFIDICDADRHVIEVTPHGWSIIQNPQVHFIRKKSQQPLPLPLKGGTLLDLKPFLNLKNDNDFIMCIAWFLRSLSPTGPYPVLAIKGGQGTAKSTLLRVCRELIDPSSAPIRSLSKNERDLFINASNTWVLAYDNVSECSSAISDALCMISTGGAFGARKLYFDEEENIINAIQPTTIAGITNLAKRGDLVERSIIIDLPPIEKGKRLPETTFWKEFRKQYPYILGAFCDALSVILKNIDSIKPDNLPRMADFTQWILAAEKVLPCVPGTFIKVYEENQRNIMDLALEADPVALAVISLMNNLLIWEDTPTNALKVLESQKCVTYKIKTSRSWPRAANKLRDHLERAEAFLRAHEIKIDLNKRDQGVKKFVFMKVTAPEKENASEPLPELNEDELYQSIF